MTMRCAQNKRRRTRTRATHEEEEDRISSLPDHLICLILSLIDVKFAVQTTILSTRWKHVWKSVPKLNFLSYQFQTKTKFSNFVSRVLSKREKDAQVSELTFFSQSVNLPLLKRIVRYTMSHSVKKVKILSALSSELGQFPLSILNSPTLEHLVLAVNLEFTNVISSSWNFPALKTLKLEQVSVGFCVSDSNSGESIDLFSQFVNLKNLTLTDLVTGNLKVFKIISSRLEHLDITANYLEENENCLFVISAPKLINFSYKGSLPLALLAGEPFGCLQIASIHVKYNRLQVENEVKEIILILSMFYQLSNARYLALTVETFQLLSYYPQLLEQYASPFTFLEILTLIKRPCSSISKVSRDVINYFRISSPSAHVVALNPVFTCDDGEIIRPGKLEIQD